jgi:hypothetical protein
MTETEPRNRVELRGRDGWDLQRRVITFTEAVAARSGDVLEISWCGADERRGHRAAVFYHVPPARRAATAVG